jgi:hypothetical protein
MTGQHDIVERAREFTAQTRAMLLKDSDQPMDCLLIDEMAAEIERLRALVFKAWIAP